MRTSIPDLRAYHDDFTLEHCSVLLETLGRELDKIYGEGFSEIAQHADAERMKDDLLSLLSARQLGILFSTEVGKGLIVGIFYTHFILPESAEE